MQVSEHLYNRIARNQRDSFFLIFGMSALLIAIGYVFGRIWGSPILGMLIAFCIAMVQALIATTVGDSLVLALSGAKEIQKEDNPVLFDVVEEMAIASGLPMPKVFIIEDSAPNAFATGKNSKQAAVAVTRGLLDRMNRGELQGVIGHEMSHVRDNDVFYTLLVGVMVGTIVLLADAFRWGIWTGADDRDDRSNAGIIIFFIGLLLSILAPIFALLIQMAVSREREYLADAGSAELTRNPLELASALEKISMHPARLRAANRATQHLYIVNPLREAVEDSPSLFDTHPPTSKRIQILRDMAHASGMAGSNS